MVRHFLGMDPEGADANAKGCPVGGIHVEWERADAVRNHLREEGAVLFAEGVAESVKNAVKPHIHAYLIPLLTRMAEHDSRPQPLVDPLRDELSLLYKNISKQCDETTIVHDSWLTRKFLGMIKMKVRKEKPSCEFCLCVSAVFGVWSAWLLMRYFIFFTCQTHILVIS